MNKKPKILILIDWYLPAYKAGGPVRSIANLVELLSDEIDFYIFTSDKDLGEKIPLNNIKSNQWVKKGGVQIFYSKKVSKRQIKEITETVQPDKVYLNSLFSKDFTLKPLLSLKDFKPKITLAPRGMLGKGALNLKKSKKFIFLRLSKLTGLYSNISWHATGEEEKREIAKMFHPASEKIFVAANIPISFQKELAQNPKKTGELKLVFYSRIAPKKNLSFLTRLLKNHFSDKNISLEIWGTKEDKKYFENSNTAPHLKRENSLEIKYCGESNVNSLTETIGKNHFFVLPTLHENFGHAIVEAMACSLPVIISDNTPWKNLAQENVGRDINLQDKNRWVEAIQECLEMDDKTYQAKRQAVKDYFEKHILSQRTQLKEKYLRYLNDGSQSE